ncbi:DUF3025 domain-containing protein [Paucibacter sp. Y2R2-4]|uniref:DUF3025 domain-containing protein n=1 Tax=Paucibacter sp. Y2R2-4 TaxID=2893553 RepID=UPI0021E3A98E|nr:DUF3025 domain-containing protein [Paucibacter sp. Y2R2-4]MCV2349962.1 DUF3025 domain-containing protein [Paucibacter sp. Y2R2-4]
MSADIAAGATVAEALNAALKKRLAEASIVLPKGPLRFVPQAELPEGEAYEAFIYRTAAVPTRDNLHDLLNGLMWLHWPLLKAGLNAGHSVALARMGGAVGPVRGALRDALTVVDENAALLRAPAPLCDALARRDWQTVFVSLRPLWAQARLQLIGHALMEKLQQPRKPICAHVLLQPLPTEQLPAEDWPDAALDLALLERKPFVPLPVLGVPGWWPANQSPEFYADTQVFRPLPSAQTR